MINEPKFAAHDYLIGGKLVVGHAILAESFKDLFVSGDQDAIQELKHTLIQQMATYMLEHNLVEFTQMDDPITGDRRVAVRAYLAPNDQIKILRLANKIL